MRDAPVVTRWIATKRVLGWEGCMVERPARSLRFNTQTR